MIKPAGNDELRILCLILFLKVWHSRRLRWQKNWFVPAEAKGLTMVSRCFTEAQRPSNSGSKTVSDQGETLSGTMLLGGATALIHPGPVRLVFTQFCPCYWWWDLENHCPHKRKWNVYLCPLIIIIPEHFLISSCCVVASIYTEKMLLGNIWSEITQNSEWRNT